MRWPFSQSVSDNLVVVSIGRTQCRFLYLKENTLCQLRQLEFSDLDELGRHLAQWIKHNGLKGLPCRWMLNRDRYQALLIDKPDVAESEIDQAAKWLVRDQLDYPPEEVILQHYHPEGSTNRADQVVLLAAQKSMIEQLIELTAQAELVLEAIAVEELCIGVALEPQLKDEQICGYIGEDENGLIFNFYRGQSLTFCRYIRGKQFPKVESQELSLDADIEEANESFLLEVQRTLDYAINQIYRSPVDELLIQPVEDSDKLAGLINQLTEVPVKTVQLAVEQANEKASGDRLNPGALIAEFGLALKETA